MNVISKNINVKALLIAATTSAWLTLSTGRVMADFKSDVEGGVGLGGTPTDSAENIFQKIVNILLFLIGAVSVIMIIVGGIRFILSRGDPQATASARNQVMYAVVGVIVAVLAWAIVNWVLGELYGTSQLTTPQPVDTGGGFNQDPL